MSYITWTPAEVWSEAKSWRASVWRMVEAQHVTATLKLVDDVREQELLEHLLETSKPVPADTTQALHYLLATPFRYPCRTGGSRFRAATDPGVFYAAQNVATAAAELGYWRWRFLMDAADLLKLPPVAHTAFKTEVQTMVVDLRAAPFAVGQSCWMHATDYSATQAFAQTARQTELGAIVYQSVRHPVASWCVALLKPTAFAKTKPATTMQSWWLVVQKDAVIWRRERQSLAFDMRVWR